MRPSFKLMNRNGRGFAKDVDVHPDGKVDLDHVHYTSCPVGNEDWSLNASKIDLDTKAPGGRRARRRHAASGMCRFSTRPIFSFPLGDERKSGLPRFRT